MDQLLKNKVSIITGGCSGMGKAGVELFTKSGSQVIIADINEEAGIYLENILRKQKLKVDFIKTDVTDTKNVQNTINEVVNRFGKIDVLFHNAVDVPLVNNHDKRITELPEEIWHKITTLIVDGTFYISKYVGQQMLKQKSGSIILTATTDALIGQAGLDAYTASKGAIISLTRSMAAGLSPEGIRVNAICPGFVETPHQMNFMNDPKIRKELEDLHLMGILQPEDIAEFALFLASDKSLRITGAIHAVDSGYTAFKGKMDLFDQITS
ncbi:MAG: SDR family oxidoreductase [Pelagibacteraceae bacterium]|jgi:NAD(P)-dependent dehydrogenase (short-subunit alcohol dehydrogenase family)|nr:SDR family oxidoreductase [Pelagibacteraceae bacterium]MBT3940171.1 SDR family oxidoreductase [Pelagibacterales bacterium]MBT4645739.1 SDR family oxidoreductase [Pelagibacteraceae bacterium]MBT4952102.1 SDR family oxidoreductase [Pelagibacteraceae bacterium]MBT5213114.1 SDR family oxidoreductase [Pelagibacteraceae bacterium]